MKKELTTSVRRLFTSAALSLALLNAACAPTRQVVIEEKTPVTVQTEIYAYPLEGQSAQQQDRDQYECSLWAIEQSGFDPSVPYLAPHQQVTVVQDTGGADKAVAGAMTGAVIGAVSGGPRGGLERTIIGALFGAFIGAAADAHEEEQVEAYYQSEQAQETAVQESEAADYRRALQACLCGRGYSVE
jgi:outer membrane lipoprotein SlyB